MATQYPVMECGAPGAAVLGTATNETDALEVVRQWVRSSDDYSWSPTIAFTGTAYVAEWHDNSDTEAPWHMPYQA